MWKEWDELPEYMRTKEVRPYYDELVKKKNSLICKRAFDFIFSVFLFLMLFPAFLVIGLWVVVDSRGNIFYRQERVTQYGKKFRIFKFRTMVMDADKIGSKITIQNDDRVTKVGKKLRKYRLDELPQLINIILGDMSFVGTRPESVYYVKKYTPEMFATLLLPAGVTSEASIQYKDEALLLREAKDVDQIYLEKILPQKMKYNLENIKNFSFLKEIGTMIKTVIAVIR